MVPVSEPEISYPTVPFFSWYFILSVITKTFISVEKKVQTYTAPDMQEKNVGLHTNLSISTFIYFKILHTRQNKLMSAL